MWKLIGFSHVFMLINGSDGLFATILNLTGPRMSQMSQEASWCTGAFFLVLQSPSILEITKSQIQYP